MASSSTRTVRSACRRVYKLMPNRYNPSDWKIKEAREKLGQLKDSHDHQARISNYKKVTEHVHPVMRHFFTEKAKLPSGWFEMRLLYTRSTAVMSMVGYVLGLGDRHVSNIMIDCHTGELVPIDFGIMFDAVSQVAANF